MQGLCVDSVAEGFNARGGGFEHAHRGKNLRNTCLFLSYITNSKKKSKYYIVGHENNSNLRKNLKKGKHLLAKQLDPHGTP